jgi:hypothetical protein
MSNTPWCVGPSLTARRSSERHRRVLETEVVHHLVVGPLHKRGIVAYGCIPSRKPHANVTPCDSAMPVEKQRKLFGKPVEPGALRTLPPR